METYFDYAHPEDLDKIMNIYDQAKAFMRSTGNLDQWNGPYPSVQILLDDMDKKQLYVLRDRTEIYAVFAFILGADPTYSYIESGEWRSDEPYGTIHRIASDGRQKDVIKKVVSFCHTKIAHIRVDTHHDNKVMQHVLEKNGFQKSGIIFLADGAPRIAYEKEDE